MYTLSDDELFTGRAQKVRGNGHLVYEEYYDNGFLREVVFYFNRTKGPIPSSRIEYYEKTFIKRKETIYNASNSIIALKYFDKEGRKILLEEYENDILTYRCEYSNSKKHGAEFCVNKDGTESRFKYLNGKKLKSQ